MTTHLNHRPVSTMIQRHVRSGPVDYIRYFGFLQQTNINKFILLTTDLRLIHDGSTTIHDGSTTIHDGSTMDAQWVYDGSAMDLRLIHDGLRRIYDRSTVDPQYDGSATDPQYIHDGFKMDSRWIQDESTMDPQ